MRQGLQGLFTKHNLSFSYSNQESWRLRDFFYPSSQAYICPCLQQNPFRDLTLSNASAHAKLHIQDIPKASQPSASLRPYFRMS